jgi:transposase InsO family protein
MEISTSGFYAWTKRSPSLHQQEDERLLKLITSVFEASRKTYGSPRIHAVLKELGHNVAKKRVARIMQENGLVVLPSRGWRCVTTQADPSHGVAPNELDRDFEASRINEKWVTDVTFVPTDEGWLYLASMIDLYNREVVGWAMSEHNDTQLTLNALDMALEFRNPPKGLIQHTDRGSNYTAKEYRRALNKRGVKVSMSRKGNCWDNAVAESFFATIKKELIHKCKFTTRREAAAAIFEYIEVFYNRVRRHSKLGYLSPAQYRKSDHPAAPAA